MSKFKPGGKKEMPGITSSSLSDIVFMLLFFFMVTTQMRDTEQKVIIKTPEASEVVKLERKDLASYINIGTPTRQYQAQFGTEARIQLNDSFKTIDDIRDFIAAERESMSEGDRQFMTVNIKADEDVRMGIITDVKQELRRCSALKIMYSARKGAE
ncbi:MAG: biopolymer transporter ExbD [Bacteroidales bacterium]|nr:biopolymer transporter ExbD [Bacteroidales bacterium]